MLTAGGFLVAAAPSLAQVAAKATELTFDSELYKRIYRPDSKYYPFVRWWWNGDILDADELRRELRVMKQAGIGGVEINPIGFPERDNDMGMLSQSKMWLSDEWIEMLQVTFDEARKLDMTCDLIVGSGWPFGGEFLKGDERAQVTVISAAKLEGPTTYETSKFNIFKEADPHATEPSAERTLEILSLKLVPQEFSDMSQVVELSDQRNNELIKVEVPKGKYVLYALVKVNAFACVINGAPGAAGPILNHLDKDAVRTYLDHMSNTIEKKTGPLKNYIRSMFTDSMELEGSNWTTDMAEEFQRRRGYDIMPYLPFTMYKTGRLGAITDYDYGAKLSPEMDEMISRMRYDFDLTRAEMLRDRFNKTYIQWCKDLGVLSRAQTYGRGFFPLDTSIGYDIPEGESWTTNWLKHKLGEEMSNEDYRRGRGYTMINKFVASGAHLTGKRIVSCEEMTNTYQVFNATLEFLKLGSDMSIFSGITHSVLIGVNYSPPQIPFPGWVRYGTYFSEHNNWWPYMPYFTGYRARVSATLQNADMYTDIAILPAMGDTWTEIGVQTDPFPEKVNRYYMTLIWEAIHKNGGACDYTSENVLVDSQVKNGALTYGPKQYKTLFLAGVKGINPETMAKLYDFVAAGGRIFCLEHTPSKSLGYQDYKQKDAEVQAWVKKLQAFPDRFILLDIPEDKDFVKWYGGIQKKHNIAHYLTVENVDPYFMQNRYQSDTKQEIFFFANGHLNDVYQGKVSFAKEITQGRYPWVWNMETGERFRLELDATGALALDLAPTESMVVVFDKSRKGEMWKPLPYQGKESQILQGWEVELKHSIEGWTRTTRMENPTDLKDTEFVDFTGTVTYRTKVRVEDPKGKVINLGKVHGVSELKINGKDCGVTWYGRRLYDAQQWLQPGENEIEVKVVTVMGNYMKTMKENKTAQYWTVEKNKNQPISSMGLVGPVELFTTEG